MEPSSNSKLIDLVLNTASSMQMLTDELDRISINSTSTSKGSHHSNSRDSLHSNSKFDSAFDSHYSEDTESVNSQVFKISPVETSYLPSILTPPLAYRTIPTSQPTSARSQSQNQQDPSHQKPRSVDSHYRKEQRRKKNHSRAQQRSAGVSPGSSPSPEFFYSKRKKFSSHFRSSTPSSKTPQTSTHHQSSSIKEVVPSTLPTMLQAEVIHLKSIESHPPPSLSPKQSPSKVVPPQYQTISSTDPVSIPHRSPPSDSSSNSWASTPTLERKHPQTQLKGGEEENGEEWTPPRPHKQEHLTPRVTIVYPNNASDSDTEYVQGSPRLTYFPKRGTLFYQDSLTPRPSPLHMTTHRHTSPGHIVPNRYRETGSTSPLHTTATNTKSPKRSSSFLQRLKRKRGSFRDESHLKKRLPVKRSFSDRMTYHIRKGWVDYEEDLEFISQPTQPRAVGRMIDKKAGKLHMIQLYKPPSGRYGIYISQTPSKKGVFVSRFADSTAEKFYTGLITPGDQIIRVNGKNISDNSVDDVYDLMTKSDSVIFTVIPVSSRPDW